MKSAQPSASSNVKALRVSGHKRPTAALRCPRIAVIGTTGPHWKLPDEQFNLLGQSSHSLAISVWSAMAHEPAAQSYEINELAQGGSAPADNFGNEIAPFGNLHDQFTFTLQGNACCP